MTIKHPMMTWAQRASHIYLSIEVSDMKVEQMAVDGDSFKLRGIKGEDSYEADMKLYGKVKGDERRQTGTDRRVELFLPKVDVEWWPRLLSEQTKVPCIKVDFDKWADEDGDDSLSFDASGGEDFGGIDFSKFGGAGGDTLGDLGEEDWEGDDDGDLSEESDEEPELTVEERLDAAREGRAFGKALVLNKWKKRDGGGRVLNDYVVNEVSSLSAKMEISRKEVEDEHGMDDWRHSFYKFPFPNNDKIPSPSEEKPTGGQENGKDEVGPEEPAADEKPTGGQESGKDEVCPGESAADEKPTGGQESGKDEVCPGESAADK